MLSCDVVRDIYPLYIEGDLSSETLREIDEHISKCSSCREFYRTGISTGEIIKSGTEENTSGKLDKEMMLKLKVGKLKGIILFILIFFTLLMLSNYSVKRRNLSIDMSSALDPLHQITMATDIIKNDYVPADSWNIYIPYQEFYEKNALIMRGLNYFEKTSIKKSGNELYLSMDYNEMIRILKLRYVSGKFTARDNRALELLNMYSRDALISYEKERDKVNETYIRSFILSPFYNINASKMAESLEKVNELTLLYTNYNALPGEMKPLTKDQIFEKLKALYPYTDLRLQQINEFALKRRGKSDFAVVSEKNKFRIYGDVDAYTGKILSIDTSNYAIKGDIISVERAKSNALKFMKQQYAPGYDFKIKYLGINKNFGSNTDIKLHTFLFTPMINGIQFSNGVQLYVDARTGIVSLVHSMYPNGQLPKTPKVTVKNLIPVKEALKKLPIPKEGSFNYLKTALIKSKITGKIETVYVFENNKTHEKKLINSTGGFEDYPWTNDI